MPTRPHPFDQLNDTTYWYPQRQKSVNEVVFRSPSAIGSFTPLTHFCLIRENPEDYFFNSVCNGLREALSNDLFVINPLDRVEFFIDDDPITETRKTLIGPDGCLIFRHQWQNYHPNPLALNPARAALLAGVAANIDEIFATLLDERPEYFIFSCLTQLTTILINKLFETHRNLRSINVDCENMVRGFQALLESYSYTIRDVIRARLAKSTQTLTEYHPNIGGMIANFRDKAVSQTSLEIFEDDFLDLDFTLSASDVEQNTFRLRWGRSQYFWTYTFYEATKFVPLVPPPLPTLEEVPDSSLFQQSDKVKNDYVSCMPRFVALLFSFGYSPSVLDSPLLRARTASDNGRFPGRLLSGAHYIFVPFGIMLGILYFPEALIGEAITEIKTVRQLEQEDGDDNFIKLITERVLHFIYAAWSAPEYREFIEILEEMNDEMKDKVGSFFIHSVRNALNTRTGAATLSTQEKIELLNIGGLLWQWLASSRADVHQERMIKISRIVGRFARDLWSAIFVNCPEPITKSSLDFINCFVVEERAVYISNFLPEGDDRFTRTIFVDLALTGYQRGRLAQRLCDISTHRSLCVRDLNRVRSIWQGMDEIAGELNRLENQLQVARATDAVTRCKNLILRLEHIQQQFDQMNLFLLYGIRGRFLSTEASLGQIRERIRDIRQTRISGFPVIGEFIERRVADAIRDTTYMSQRYDYLRERIQDAYNRVRTQLNSIQTENMVRFSENTARFVRDS